MIELSKKQRQAYDACMDFLFNHESSGFVFSGCAGSGKSTIIKNINDAHRKIEVPLVNVALTGRAVSVMRSKGIDNCKTIHSLLYVPVIDEDTKELIRFDRRSTSEIQSSYGAIIIDEASMVNQEIFDDLMSVGLPLLFVGDKEQLPPIDESGFDIMANPDIHLSEIHRQAESNPIIQLSRDIRETGRINRQYESDEIHFIGKYDVTKPFLVENNPDIILTGTNKLRKKYNTVSRAAKQFHDEYPEPGEVVICLRNQIVDGIPIHNGERYVVEQVLPFNKEAHKYYLTSMDSGNKLWVLIKDQCWDEIKVRSEDGYGVFTFGDSVSVWKAQGSEFDNVLFVDENVSFFSDQRRFRYTAVTRAVQRLTIAG